ncbi:CpsD/CapB family tyrosine-protein kinase [Yoonia sp.]|uniref:CpsD/CapB family tyrosine-protein kinase n=1 Tax=Yoonia sp. TaxID=2212373 RepID=UPI002383B923|nr:CpsD/CapB family tyrosine-protein kinase [Yoonia sp.]MDE0850930.1 CpsD/CapB family tyrosine-protein kinase [Yoonia sp.]
MSTIQEAIAKARAARGDAPTPVAAPVGDDPWDSLTVFKPSIRRLRRNRVVAADGGRPAMDFDVIRTRMMQVMAANGWKRVAITSPTAACGKSTMVMNLAYSLSRHRDHRTMVLEMDMRKPSLSRAMQIPGEHQFSRVLEGRAPFEDHAVRVNDNLIFATNVNAVAGSAELLQSPGTAAVLDDLTARYAPDTMLFDMPPMLTGDDTMAFLSRVDCVLLLAAAEETSIKQIDKCERDIASQTNVMGVILNKCRYMDRDNAYDYYE